MTPKQEIMTLVEDYVATQVRQGVYKFKQQVEKKREKIESCIDKKLAEAEAAAFSLNGLKRFLKGKLWH